MSVSKMKRLTVFVHGEKLDELIKKLMRLRCVEISNSEDTNSGGERLDRIDCEAARSAIDGELGRVTEAITLLEPYIKKGKGIFPKKEKLDADAFIAEKKAEKAEKITEEVLSIAAGLEELRTEEQQQMSLITSVSPYRRYTVPLSLTETESTEIFLGVLPPSTNIEENGKALYEAGAVSDILLADKSGVYGVYICHKSDSSAVNSVLAEYGFLRASFGDVNVTADEALRNGRRRIKVIEARRQALKQKLSDLSESVPLLEAYYDIKKTELTAAEQKLKLVRTAKVAIVKGWIPEGREASVVSFLDRFECAYETAEPTEAEVPPILLKNNGFASNFEWVLGMYSYPQYGRFDPTFIMSIFYFLIFGIMFADVGYGLVLTLACFSIVTFLKPPASTKRFLKMFGYCGLSCILFGVLFGSYFGDLPLAFMKNMLGMTEEQLPNLAIIKAPEANLALWLDPLQNPMGFLIFSLAVGGVHLVAGMAVKFYILCRDGKVLDAFLDIGLYWVLFAGIGLLFVYPSVGKWVAIAGAALIVLTHGRAEKGFGKVTKGLLGLYDLIGFASDLLSYSRILALGLSAAIIGQVVNILATMLGPSVIGFIVLVAVFLLGHLLNLAINVLGTFVHTSRLQYIEFFGKFYEDGGAAFEPALPSEKFTEEGDGVTDK